MGPTPRIPPELKRRPFSLAEARALGISRTVLRGPSWRHLATELYCWAGLAEDPCKLLAGWLNLLPPTAVFAGATAAWLHGLDLDPIHPIEVIVPPSSGVRSRPGIRVRRSDIDVGDVVRARGLPATTIYRALFDLRTRLPDVEALAAVDASLHLRLVDKADLMRSGTRRFRALAALAEPAESPMETRLRWLLVKDGLATPEVQKDLHDATGTFVGRADLYFPTALLVIEYDGANHRDRLVQDDRRHNLITNAGFKMLRFTAGDVLERPEVVCAQVRAALRAATRPQPPRLAPNAQVPTDQPTRLAPNEPPDGQTSRLTAKRAARPDQDRQGPAC